MCRCGHVRLAIYILAIMVLISAPATVGAAKVISQPIYQKPVVIYSAYHGSVCDGQYDADSLKLRQSTDIFRAVPGVLAIDPGGITPLNGWPNFVSAAKPVGPPGGLWTVVNVAMRKVVPRYLCTTPISGVPYYVQGSENIRLWWPLMYEIPGTEWRLTISYKTLPWDDDGPTGPNLAATTHQDVWTWKLDANFDSLRNLVDLFYRLPFGSCEVPMISSKAIYDVLTNYLVRLQQYPDRSDPQFTSDLFDFIMLVEESCLMPINGACPTRAGICNTYENPAGCRLLAEAEYILMQTSQP